MERYPIRDYTAHCCECAPRMFDILISEDGDAIIETKREKISCCISLRDAFQQMGMKIDYRIKRLHTTERSDP